MEVLLLEDIPGVGKKNDLLVVGNGYALNYLLPGRKALVVTPNVRRHYAEKIRVRALEREQEKQKQVELGQVLKGKRVTLKVSASKTGKLYGSVTTKMLADAISRQLRAPVREDLIRMARPIKSVGMHEVGIGTDTDSIPLTVEVLAQEQTAKKGA